MSTQNNLLKFSSGKSNAKLQALNGVVYTFSLPSGWSCPAAKDCLSKVVNVDGKYHIEDGKDTQFRCFSATQEGAFSTVRRQREYNFKLLQKNKTSADKAMVIIESIPKTATIVRVHVAGDFYNQDYFDAWLMVAKFFPKITFYAYTKSLNYWIPRIDQIPTNMKLTASKGGKHDALIAKYGLKYAEVVYSEQEAKDKGLEIDHDDSLAIYSTKPFALLLHGTQPKGSRAAEALKALAGIGSYGKPKHDGKDKNTTS